MGLTIHYSLSTKIRDARDVHQRVEALHHRAMRAIAQIVGEWNTMVAGYAGQLKDQLGGRTRSVEDHKVSQLRASGNRSACWRIQSLSQAHRDSDTTGGGLQPFRGL